MVPGSTLMYGSSFIIVTRRPRASRMAASDAEAMPLPSEDTTPPVTKIRGVMDGSDPLVKRYFTGLRRRPRVGFSRRMTHRRVRDRFVGWDPAHRQRAFDHDSGLEPALYVAGVRAT